ncbi:MAG: DUF4179 domain-containing protein [Faecalibacterium sp.]|nr:DUF4179 domain-containing protein [Ruminococcus sp.]MCM1391821.1 DUF4179 domain-containing protein [Ruminococcus sp.]MCM1485467.1 DUF4179 domain-containing protein [Faecalibacterium sp.]
MDKKRYINEFDSIRPSESFKQDTIVLLKQHKINSAKEEKTMSKRKFIMPLVAVVLILTLACSAFAVSVLLHPSQVAERLDEPALAEVFAEDSTVINQSVKSKGYEITLMGIASGKNLVNFAETDKTKSYVVFAVSRTDGTKLDIMDNHPVSFAPVFDGTAAWRFNGFDLSFGVSSFVEDGTYYSLFCYDDLSEYIEKGVSIFAFDGDLLGPSSNIFTFNSESGKNDYNKNYDGVKAVFTLK